MQADSPSADLLHRIPLAARTVLFDGCDDAALIEAYRRMNPRADFLTANPDPGVASVDCIVHYSSPGPDAGSLIRRYAEALSPDGAMLVRVANSGHRAEDIRQLLLSAGLTICDVLPTGIGIAPSAPLSPGLSGRRPPAPAATGSPDKTDHDRWADRPPGPDAPEYVTWRVRKEPRQPLILSSTMLDPIGGVSDVRVVHPLSALATDASLRTVVSSVIAGREPHDDTPRIFVLHRPVLAGQTGLATVRSLTAAGYLVVTEFDDHPDHFDMMRLGGDLTFRGVHALQTSTSNMAEALRQYNPEIAVFPNAMVSLPEVRNFAAPPTVTLFFGALNRERDWRPLMPAINAVASKAADRLRFRVVHDRGFFDALETPHKQFTPTCDYETYLRLLGGSEISFMPLSDTPFNRAKSDLKFIEAAACRVAPLASTVVYGDSIEDGRTGLLFRDPAEFHARLLRLVALPGLARDLGDAGREHVAKTRMLAYQVAPRIAWYRSLWARRDALTEALNARLAAGLTLKAA